MVLKLAAALDVPLRGRNELLRSAGLPPLYTEHGLDDAALRPYREVIRRMLEQQEPFPAYVLDRHWDILATNEGGRWLLPDGPLPVDSLAWILDGPVGHALDNRADMLWAFHDAIQSDLAQADDAVLRGKLERVTAALGDALRPELSTEHPVLSPVLRWNGQEIRTFTTIMRFGQAREITLDELRVELVYPVDAASEAAMRALAGT
jgi:hypothetical protein